MKHILTFTFADSGSLREHRLLGQTVNHEELIHQAEAQAEELRHSPDAGSVKRAADTLARIQSQVALVEDPANRDAVREAARRLNAQIDRRNGTPSVTVLRTQFESGTGRAASLTAAIALRRNIPAGDPREAVANTELTTAARTHLEALYTEIRNRVDSTVGPSWDETSHTVGAEVTELTRQIGVLNRLMTDAGFAAQIPALGAAVPDATVTALSDANFATDKAAVQAAADRYMAPGGRTTANLNALRTAFRTAAIKRTDAMAEASADAGVTDGIALINRANSQYAELQAIIARALPAIEAAADALPASFTGPVDAAIGRLAVPPAAANGAAEAGNLQTALRALTTDAQRGRGRSYIETKVADRGYTATIAGTGADVTVTLERSEARSEIPADVRNRIATVLDRIPTTGAISGDVITDLQAVVAGAPNPGAKEAVRAQIVSSARARNLVATFEGDTLRLTRGPSAQPESTETINDTVRAKMNAVKVKLNASGATPESAATEMAELNTAINGAVPEARRGALRTAVANDLNRAGELTNHQIFIEADQLKVRVRPAEEIPAAVREKINALKTKLNGTNVQPADFATELANLNTAINATSTEAPARARMRVAVLQNLNAAGQLNRHELYIDRDEVKVRLRGSTDRQRSQDFWANFVDTLSDFLVDAGVMPRSEAYLARLRQRIQYAQNNGDAALAKRLTDRLNAPAGAPTQSPEALRNALINALNTQFPGVLFEIKTNTVNGQTKMYLVAKQKPGATDVEQQNFKRFKDFVGAAASQDQVPGVERNDQTVVVDISTPAVINQFLARLGISTQPSSPIQPSSPSQPSTPVQPSVPVQPSGTVKTEVVQHGSISGGRGSRA